MTRVAHIAEMVKRFRSFAGRSSTWDAFRDFLELSAISISNTMDTAQRAEREARYMKTIGKYTPEEVKAFPEILGLLTLALEEEEGDVLGRVYAELELANKWGGQFFTPQSLADMMGAMVLDEGARAQIAARGFLTLSEPACGGGALVIGFCKAMRAAGLNYQRQLHVTAVDVDEKAVHMAYVQLSLLHVPALIVHGNTLSLQEWGHWYTPAHILGGWSARLADRDRPRPEGRRNEGAGVAPRADRGLTGGAWWAHHSATRPVSRTTKPCFGGVLFLCPTARKRIPGTPADLR